MKKPAPAPLRTEQPEERSDLVRQMFDRLCHRYDLNNTLLSFGLDAYWRWRARRMLNLEPCDRVIDLCCGTGVLTRTLARAVPGGEVVGVDFSEGMLGPARVHPGKEGSGAVRYIQSDVLQVPLEDHQFDALTIAFGPRNIVDLPGLWAEMQRLVKPGGQILSLELSRPTGLMGVLHGLYLRYVVPFVGRWVSGDPEAYTYLSRTIEGFLAPRDLADSMIAGGLREVKIVPLSGGIVTIHHARTPE